MPRKFMFTREEVVSAALELVREGGISALTARALGQKLGSSSRPVFGLFRNMEEVRQEVIKAAEVMYRSFLETDMRSGKYPPYKASGMAYIRFAREEKELFKLLFMRDRSAENVGENPEEIRPLIEIIKKNLGLGEDEAYMFHLEMWIYVHGIASMIATSYINMEEEFVSRILTDSYFGLKERFISEYGNKSEEL